MTRPTRYQTQSLVATHGAVTTHRGVDPLTGLPVLIYTFEGRSPPSVDELESENIPGILESTWDGARGRVVAATSADYRPLAAGPHGAAKLLEAARGLRDAAEAGIVHGDLRPERFLEAEGHVLIEGYGVPWSAPDDRYRAPELGPDASGTYSGDVYAWAASMRALGGAEEPAAEALLQRCLADDPNARPTALELFEGLAAAVPPKRPSAGERAGKNPSLVFDVPEADEPAPPPPDEGELELDYRAPAGATPAITPALDIDEPPAPEVGGDAPASPQSALSPLATTWGRDEADPLPDVFGRGRPKAREEDDGPVFVKDLPPGAVYRPGVPHGDVRPSAIRSEGAGGLDAGASGPSQRRIWLVVFLIVCAAALAALAFRTQTASEPLAGSLDRTVHQVQIDVEPRTMPPVRLLIVQSPPGATLEAGTEYGTVAPSGRTITLGTAGEWSFQGVFQDRASEVVTLQVPAELRATLVFPSRAGP